MVKIRNYESNSSSIKIVEASSNLRDIKNPFNSTAIGSFNGARKTTSISEPETNPSSNNFVLIWDGETSNTIPFVPILI